MAGAWNFGSGSDEGTCVNLRCHKDTPSAAVKTIELQIFEASPHKLHVRYFVTGDVNAICWPESSAPARADGLWQTTCFEAFVRSPGGTAYDEYNLSPCGSWAAYHFDNYRSGMANISMTSPSIWLDAGADWVGIEVECVGDTLVPAHFNFTAVIEEMDGNKSYWALKHSDGPPDFHDPACFVLELGAPGGA